MPLGRINFPVTLRRNVLVVCGAVLIANAAGLRASEARAQMKADFVATSSVNLKNPHDLKLSPESKHLFVSDVGNNRVPSSMRRPSRSSLRLEATINRESVTSIST